MIGPGLAAVVLAIGVTVVAAAGPAAAAPDNARGCPPGWGAMSISPEGSLDDLETWVWANVPRPEGFAAYLPLIDNNGNGEVCIRWTWGERLPERSVHVVRAEADPELSEPPYHFVVRDDTSAAPPR